MEEYERIACRSKKIWAQITGKTKRSCHRQDPFQNINPNITLEIKSSFSISILWPNSFGHFFFELVNQLFKIKFGFRTDSQRKYILYKIAN